MSVSSVKNWRDESPVWGKQTIQKTPTAAVRQLDLLPGIEPGLKTGMVQKCRLFGNSTDPERPAPAERVWKVRIARLSQKAMI